MIAWLRRKWAEYLAARDAIYLAPDRISRGWVWITVDGRRWLLEVWI